MALAKPAFSSADSLKLYSPAFNLLAELFPMASIADIKSDAQTRMQKSLESLKNEFSRLRTGRASVGVLDGIRVDYYGTPTPLAQVANVTVADSRTLQVQPWEKNMVGAVEKAIIAANLGLNPNVAGMLIRIALPPLTEQRRKELAKVVSQEGETAKVAIRNVRRDGIQHIKELLKGKLITEDEEKKAEDDMQKLTDKFVKEVDVMCKAKEDELMQL
jgi:ribosome recycling factor